MKKTADTIKKRPSGDSFGSRSSGGNNGAGMSLSADERKLLSGAIALGHRYSFNEAHGMQVAKLAVSLFDRTHDLHRLSRKERKLLLVAGVVHDIGMVVGATQHHKHSMYLIAESELPGLTARQTISIALVARYHRKGEPSSRHRLYDTLSAKEKSVVDRLSAILRLADVLDRDHRQSVNSIAVIDKKKKLSLRFSAGEGFQIDLRVFKAKSEWFEKVFTRRVALSRRPLE